MKLDRLTASMIRDYRASPRLFYYRHLLRLKLPQKQMNLLFGSAVHDGIETFHKTKSLDNSLAAFEKTFDINKLIDEEKDEYLPHLSEGHRLLKQYIDAQDYLHIVHGIQHRGQSEMFFRNSWIHPLTSKTFDVPITGRIDRIAGDDIIEFKTSKKPYRQEDIDSMVQPTIYSRAFILKYRREPRRVVYIILIKGREEAIQVLETKRSISDYALIQDEAEYIKEQVEKENFPRGRGFHMVWNDEPKYEELLKV